MFEQLYSDLPFLVDLTRNLQSFDKTLPYANFRQKAAQLNVPFLFVACELLSRRYNKMVFLGRDCQLMDLIYSSFYGPCRYLPFSRQVAKEETEAAAKYLPRGAELIDISSTGETWSRFKDPFDVTVIIYGSGAGIPVPPRMRYLLNTAYTGPSGFFLEILNCGNQGRLMSIHESKFDAPELPADLVKAIHAPIWDAISLKPNISAIKNISDSRLFELLQLFVALISVSYDTVKDDPIMKQYIEQQRATDRHG